MILTHYVYICTDGLNIFWTACYEQRLRIQTAVDHKLSERRAKGLVVRNVLIQVLLTFHLSRFSVSIGMSA